MLESLESHQQKPCLPVKHSFVTLLKTDKNSSLNLCNTWEEENFVDSKIVRPMLDYIMYSCNPSCIQSQYEGDDSFFVDEANDPNEYRIIYMFPKSQVEVSEEYFMIGVNELIGTIGGHSGLFISFSFYGFVSEFLGYIRKKMLE